MARTSTGETYTYYRPDAAPQVVENDVLQGRGRVWTPGRYAPPTYPNPLNVRVGDAGVKVWMVIGWLRIASSDDDTVSQHATMITPDDLKAARWYYVSHREEIDQKLVDEGWVT